MNTPLVSIIMPAYNAQAYIAQSIESVLAQTYKNFELLICNDASKDNTLEIITNLSKLDDRILLLENKNSKGVSGARNTAIFESKGKYIAFLDSDDLWHKDKLEKQINLLEEKYDLISCAYATFPQNRNHVKNIRKAPKYATFDDMLKGNLIGNLTGVYNAAKLGKFYQKNIGSEDYLMWLEITKKAGQVHFINDILAFYRVLPNSLSANKIKSSKWQWEIYRYHLKFNRTKSLYYFIFYVLNSIKKRI